MAVTALEACRHAVLMAAAVLTAVLAVLNTCILVLTTATVLACSYVQCLLFCLQTNKLVLIC